MLIKNGKQCHNYCRDALAAFSNWILDQIHIGKKTQSALALKISKQLKYFMNDKVDEIIQISINLGKYMLTKCHANPK